MSLVLERAKIGRAHRNATTFSSALSPSLADGRCNSAVDRTFRRRDAKDSMTDKSPALHRCRRGLARHCIFFYKVEPRRLVAAFSGGEICGADAAERSRGGNPRHRGRASADLCHGLAQGGHRLHAALRADLHAANSTLEKRLTSTSSGRMCSRRLTAFSRSDRAQRVHSQKRSRIRRVSGERGESRRGHAEHEAEARPPSRSA